MLKNVPVKIHRPFFTSPIAVCILSVYCVMMTGCLHVQTNARGLQTVVRPIQNDTYEVLGPAMGMNSGFRLLWFIPVTPCACADKAVNDAIYSKGGDNLIEVKYWHERQYWLVGTVDIIHVEGIVIRYKSEDMEE